MLPGERSAIVSKSPHVGRYEQQVDRESAYEILQARLKRAELEAISEQERLEWEEEREKIEKERDKLDREQRKRSTSRGRSSKDPLDDLFGDAANTFGRELGRTIVRGIFGSLKRR